MSNASTKYSDPSAEKKVNTSNDHDDRADNESADPKKDEESKHASVGDTDDKPKHMHDES